MKAGWGNPELKAGWGDCWLQDDWNEGFVSGSGAGLHGKYFRSGTGPVILEMEIPSGRVNLSRSTKPAGVNHH